MADDSEEIDALKLRVFELQATVVFLAAQMRGLENLCQTIWAFQGVEKLHETDSIRTVCRKMAWEEVDRVLADYADTNVVIASLLREMATKTLGEDPRNLRPEDLEEGS